MGLNFECPKLKCFNYEMTAKYKIYKKKHKFNIYKVSKSDN